MDILYAFRPPHEPITITVFIDVRHNTMLDGIGCSASFCYLTITAYKENFHLRF